MFALALPALAGANGDPPSDVLPSQDVYLPLAPAATDGVARALLELTQRTRADGWPIKVAIIATPADVGDLSMLFTRPQKYADRLAVEIGDPRLLVVTPVGFGGQKLGKGVGALSAMAPVQPGGDRLERQALAAVAELAAADGHRVSVPAIDTSEQGRRPYRRNLELHARSPTTTPTPGPSGSERDGGGSSPLVYGAPVAVVLLLLAAGTLRDRIRRKRRETDAGEPAA